MLKVSSTVGFIALLDEPDMSLKVYGLKCLHGLLDQFWPEIAEASSKIESLYEDESFEERELAALVASKLYCHLGEFGDSINFLLGAGSLFNINSKDEYVEFMLTKCIDAYVAARKKMRSNYMSEGQDKIDPRLENIVESVFESCFENREYKQVIGIALESARLDVIEEAILKGDSSSLSKYVMNLALSTVEDLNLRKEILHMLVKIYRNLPEPDWISISHCLLHFRDPLACSELLKTLVDNNNTIMACQIAFDFEENATQDFLAKIMSYLPKEEETQGVGSQAAKSESEDTPLLADSTSLSSETAEAFKKIRIILTGKLSIGLYLEFLVRNNHTDLTILKNTKDTLDSRNSAYHSAITFANTMMNAGTTSDEFLCQSLEWLSRATNWTKFSATAALGIIHRGQLERGMTLLSPYLPRQGGTVSAYFEGGALLALGFINANHGAGVIDYLVKMLVSTHNEIIQHGACLGIGVAAMATANNELYECLKNTLFTDKAISGGAAAYAMGLVMLGTGSAVATRDMLYYIRETQHEKVGRGLAMGLAMLMYGKEHGADHLIEDLCNDKDPIIRYGGVYTIALAYSGTGNNGAVSKLLRIAVTDANDDIRRAAVTSLGFVLFRTPEQVPRVVQLLSESYSPHLRYGATLAIGIACAGTGLSEALDILDPMTKDSVDYVRQGALIATAMVLIQHNKVMNHRVTGVRRMFEKIIEDKHEDTMAKFGAILGQGIIDAGGRNSTISLQSRSGFLNMSAIVGMAVFIQYWYWYPLTHFLSLAFTPTAIIGLNKDLKLPKFTFISNVRPEMFAYQPQIRPPTEEKMERVTTAVLSTTVKTIRRAKKLESQKKERSKPSSESMSTDERDSAQANTHVKINSPTQVQKKSTTQADDMDVDTKDDLNLQDHQEKRSNSDKNIKTKPRDKKRKQQTPSYQTLENLARVLPTQLDYISFPKDSRYVPVRKEVVGGIIMLHDLCPNQPEEIVSLKPLEKPATPHR